MQATMTNVGVTLGAFLLGLPLGVGVFETGQSIVSPERSLTVEYLKYEPESGLVKQRIVPSGGIIVARWTAEILRGERTLCSGGGKAPYEGNPAKFTPSEWTGGTCPDLQSGDILRGAWEYDKNGGITVTISKTIEVQ